MLLPKITPPAGTEGDNQKTFDENYNKNLLNLPGPIAVCLKTILFDLAVEELIPANLCLYLINQFGLREV